MPRYEGCVIRRSTGIRAVLMPLLTPTGGGYPGEGIGTVSIYINGVG